MEQQNIEGEIIPRCCESLGINAISWYFQFADYKGGKKV